MKTALSLPEGAVIEADGVWSQALSALRPGPPRPALFLDRDGVVIEEVGYLSRPADVRLVAGAARLIARANRLEVPVVIVTNQAGIAHRYYGWDDFIAVQERLLALLARAGASLDGVFGCPHHPEGRPPYRHADHPARKPNPDMLLRAAKRLNLDLSRSWIIGDRASDLEAGRNAGLAGGLHVRTGHGATEAEQARARALAREDFRAIGLASVADAYDLLPVLGDGPGPDAITRRRSG